jgi:hypothetical protein
VTDKPLTIIALDRVTMRAEVSTNDAVHAWLQSCAEIMDQQIADQIEQARAAREDFLIYGTGIVHLPDACWADNYRWAIRALSRHHVPQNTVSD